jgi:hypothetical protein
VEGFVRRPICRESATVELERVCRYLESAQPRGSRAIKISATLRSNQSKYHHCRIHELFYPARATCGCGERVVNLAATTLVQCALSQESIRSLIYELVSTLLTRQLRPSESRATFQAVYEKSPESAKATPELVCRFQPRCASDSCKHLSVLVAQEPIRGQTCARAPRVLWKPRCPWRRDWIGTLFLQLLYLDGKARSLRTRSSLYCMPFSNENRSYAARGLVRQGRVQTSWCREGTLWGTRQSSPGNCMSLFSSWNFGARRVIDVK